MVTMSTVGYGDISCKTTLGQVFAVFFLLFAIVSFYLKIYLDEQNHSKSNYFRLHLHLAFLKSLIMLVQDQNIMEDTKRREEKSIAVIQLQILLLVLAVLRINQAFVRSEMGSFQEVVVLHKITTTPLPTEGLSTTNQSFQMMNCMKLCPMGHQK